MRYQIRIYKWDSAGRKHNTGLTLGEYETIVQATSSLLGERSETVEYVSVVFDLLCNVPVCDAIQAA